MTHEINSTTVDKFNANASEWYTISLLFWWCRCDDVNARNTNRSSVIAKHLKPKI